jgi:hypothetical protein
MQRVHLLDESLLDVIHRAVFEKGPARDYVAFFFEDSAVREYGDEVLCVSDFALQAFPELSMRYRRVAAGWVDGRGEGVVDCGGHGDCVLWGD